VAEVRRGHVTLTAVYVRYNLPGHDTCPHCGVGQLTKRVGVTCSYCGGAVVKVRERADTHQLHLFTGKT